MRFSLLDFDDGEQVSEVELSSRGEQSLAGESSSTCMDLHANLNITFWYFPCRVCVQMRLYKYYLLESPPRALSSYPKSDAPVIRIKNLV